MNQPLLTVVIPITRMAGKLENLNQTLKNAAQNDIQVILVHDIADADTSNQLIELTTEYPRSKLILTEGVFGNPGDARNAGLELVSGQWFAFWDSDDLPNVEEFSSMVASASMCGADIAIGGIETCSFGSESVRNSFLAFPIESRDSIFNFAQMPAFTRMAFRNVKFNRVKFPGLSMGEDLVFLARSRFLERNIYTHPKCVYLYVLNFPGQLTSNSTRLMQVALIWEHLYEESKKTAGVMNRYITFQMLRNQLVTVKMSHRLPLKKIKWSLLHAIKNPLLSIMTIFHILRNQNLLERKSEN